MCTSMNIPIFSASFRIKRQVSDIIEPVQILLFQSMRDNSISRCVKVLAISKRVLQGVPIKEV